MAAILNIVMSSQVICKNQAFSSRGKQQVKTWQIIDQIDQNFNRAH
jgi:hypothetical protein